MLKLPCVKVIMRAGIVLRSGIRFAARVRVFPSYTSISCGFWYFLRSSSDALMTKMIESGFHPELRRDCSNSSTQPVLFPRTKSAFTLAIYLSKQNDCSSSHINMNGYIYAKEYKPKDCCNSWYIWKWISWCIWTPIFEKTYDLTNFHGRCNLKEV